MFLLRRARQRGHIVEGQAVALSNIDRGRRADQGLAGRGRSARRADGARLGVRERAGAARARRQRSVPTRRARSAEYGFRDGLYFLSGEQAQAILELQAAAPDRARAGQADRGLPERSSTKSPSCRTSSRPSAAGRRHRGELNEIRDRVRRRPQAPKSSLPARSVGGRSDHRRRRRGDDFAPGLCEDAAARAIPGPAPGRPRQSRHRRARTKTSSSTC